MQEMYCRTYATENEHYLIYQNLCNYTQHHAIYLDYYRKIKTGHQPMWREFKVHADTYDQLLKLAEDFKDDIDNSWREGSAKI